MKSYNKPTRAELAKCYKSKPLGKKEAVKFKKEIAELSDKYLQRIEDKLDKIAGITPDFSILFKKRQYGSWCKMLSSENIRDLNQIRLWLKYFTLNRLNLFKGSPIIPRPDIDKVYGEFCKLVLELQSPKLKFKISERLKKPVNIFFSVRVEDILRNPAAVYVAAQQNIELCYPEAYGGKDNFRVLLIHELCHAYLQRTDYGGEVWNTYPLVTEAVADILTARMIGVKELRRYSGSNYDAYTVYRRVVELLCAKSGGKIDEYDFINACNSKASQRELIAKLNAVYSKKVDSKNILKYLEDNVSAYGSAHTKNDADMKKRYDNFKKLLEDS